MAVIKLHFYKGPGDLFDKAIRLWQSVPVRDEGSQYSHVEVEIGGVTYSADAGGDRVIRHPFKYHNPQHWDTLILPCNALMPCVRFLDAQVGKRYDYVGIFTAQILALPFDDPKRWFCSELCAAACKVGGIDLPHHNSWYNPRRLYNALHGYNGPQEV